MTDDRRPSTADWVHPLWASATTTGVGAATWVYTAWVGGRREAWDSELYFLFVIPAIALMAAVVAFFVPDRFWRWAMLPFAGQALVAFIQNPTANLLPIGLLVFALHGALCIIPAAAGAAIGRRVAR